MAFVPYQGMPQGWMRQIIGASRSRPLVFYCAASHSWLSRRPTDCLGHFWDNHKKHPIAVNLGFVSLRVPPVFRAAASVSSETTFEGVEAAAQNAEIPFFTDVHFERFRVRVVCNTRTNANRLAKTC